jgi:hypothetical protein
MSLRPARGERLRVMIDDGDSPPLEEPAFSAVIRQPALLFSLPSAGRATLRFGGGRAHLPRYDLAGLLPDRRATGERAEAAAALYDVGAARLGRIAPNPAYDGAPALAFAMRAGAPVERGLFRQVRSLRVPDSAEGLSRLTLDESDLAILRDDLSDLRVADDSSLQWPYLVEPEAVEWFVPLEVQGPERHESESRYRLEPPVESIRPNRIVFQTDTPYFDREFRLVAEELEGEQVTLAEGRIARPTGDPRPVAIDFPSLRVRSMELIVEDGDDASLVFGPVQARLLLPNLYLTAPAGTYSLLLGAPDLDPARYDLERVRDMVLAVKADPVQAGDLQANPDFSLQARLTGSGTRQRVILWSVLVAAVLILGGLTLRLARSG